MIWRVRILTVYVLAVMAAAVGTFLALLAR